jgi:hypothetical protein
MRRMWLAFGAALAVALPAAATTAGAALAAPAPRAAAPGTHPAAAGPVAARHDGNAAGGTRLWLARFIVPPDSVGYAISTVASPDGSQVFITGSGAGSSTVAYDAATGAQHWAAPTGLSNGGFLAVSPDGSRVFITGTSPDASGFLRMTTRAFDAATGAILWTAFYRSPGTVTAGANALAMSPDGSRVFITGSSEDSGLTSRYTTVAYDAATGARRWAAAYRVQHQSARAASIAVSPLGTQVFVTGASLGPPNGHYAFATVSYKAATGATQWVARYAATPRRNAAAVSVAVSPDGSRVYVAGTAHVISGQTSPQVIAAVAYSAATGTKRWSARYPGNPQATGESAVAMALSPDGSGVFVASQGNTHGKTDYTTVAFGAATGARRWASQDSLNGFGLPRGIAVNPGGTKVFVTGHTFAGSASSGETAYATVAYDAATGAERWKRIYPGPVPGFTQATGIAASPDGTRVFVTGGATGPNGQPGVNYTTLAYAP